jgi:hypothetical protein
MIGHEGLVITQAVKTTVPCRRAISSPTIWLANRDSRRGAPGYAARYSHWRPSRSHAILAVLFAKAMIARSRARLSTRSISHFDLRSSCLADRLRTARAPWIIAAAGSGSPVDRCRRGEIFRPWYTDVMSSQPSGKSSASTPQLVCGPQKSMRHPTGAPESYMKRASCEGEALCPRCLPHRSLTERSRTSCRRAGRFGGTSSAF